MKNEIHHGMRALSSLMLTAVLSACTTPQMLDTAGGKSVAVPTGWSAAAVGTATSTTASTADLVQWWQRFNDPMLNQLIAQALQANNSVQSAQAALRQARALRDVSAASLSPSVNASASAQRSKSGSSAAANSFAAGFDASWEPDIFGANHAGVRASDANARASAASLANVQVSVAAEVALSYIQWRGTQARLDIARANVASQGETLQITHWRVQAGLLTSLEGEQARTASEQAQAQLPTLETSATQNLHALEVLCGQAPESLRQQLAVQAAVPQAQDNLALSLPAETLRQRPDVRAAEQQVKAALAKWQQADAARYPSFHLSGSLGLRALTLGALGDGGTLASSLLGSVAMPLLDGGALRAQAAAQQAALEQAQAAYRSTVLTALKDVEDALVALRNDKLRLQSLKNALEAATNAALIARQRYASGLIDFQVVLETQRSLYSAQDSVASTSTDLSTDHVRLYKALGGGWQPDQDSQFSAIEFTRGAQDQLSVKPL